MTIRIGILEVGDRPQELHHTHPSYANMVAEWLGAIEAEVSHYSVIKGDTLPSPTDADLWAITGSKHSVYENLPWIPKLMAFIVQAKAAKVKMLGICFGHQIMAQALGGEVIKADKGWGVGLAHYTIQGWPESLATPPVELSINAYHQDQIVKLPEQAVTLAESSFCPFAALWYPEFGISFQGHPEFSKDYESDLISLRSQLDLLDKNLATSALDSLKGENNRLLWAKWLANNWQAL